MRILREDGKRMKNSMEVVKELKPFAAQSFEGATTRGSYSFPVFTGGK